MKKIYSLIYSSLQYHQKIVPICKFYETFNGQTTHCVQPSHLFFAGFHDAKFCFFFAALWPPG